MEIEKKLYQWKNSVREHKVELIKLPDSRYQHIHSYELFTTADIFGLPETEQPDFNSGGGGAHPQIGEKYWNVSHISLN